MPDVSTGREGENQTVWRRLTVDHGVDVVDRVGECKNVCIES